MINLNVGYQLDQTVDHEQKALEIAFELVREARQLGRDIRIWTSQMNSTGQLILKQIRIGSLLSRQAQIPEINLLEKKVMEGLRSYMNGLANLTNALKPLNPPLRSEQISSFKEAIVADRNLSVESMAPLTKTIAAIMLLKETLLAPKVAV